MLNLSDKRTHFRFPVYDDETGVKLKRKRNREFLKDILESYNPTLIRQRINEVIIQKIQNEILKHQPKQILKG